ncbi:MAG TPA: hypothetical protein VF188_04720 [Longimicrobiales bacterium]
MSIYPVVEQKLEDVGEVLAGAMRDSAFDSSIRQYAITGRGVTVIPRDEMTRGIPAATARLPSEAGLRRADGEERR